MLSRLRSAGRAIAIVGAFLRHVRREPASGAESKAPVFDVTLFRLVVTLPEIGRNRRSKP